jgi:hypothetical protein
MLFSTPSVPPSHPVKTGAARSTFSLGSGLTLSGVQELNMPQGPFKPPPPPLELAETETDMDMQKGSKRGGGRLSKRAIAGPIGETSRIHSR